MPEPLEVQQYFIFPTNAIDNNTPVNIVIMSTFNRITNFDVHNLDPDTGKPQKTFSITFSPNPVSKQGQIIEWRYRDEVCRDADYDSLKAKVSVTI